MIICPVSFVLIVFVYYRVDQNKPKFLRDVFIMTLGTHLVNNEDHRTNIREVAGLNCCDCVWSPDPGLRVSHLLIVPT